MAEKPHLMEAYGLKKMMFGADMKILDRELSPDLEIFHQIYHICAKYALDCTSKHFGKNKVEKCDYMLKRRRLHNSDRYDNII
jgi:hypothetical protein